MTATNFSHLAQYETDETIDFYLPIKAVLRGAPTPDFPEGELIEPMITLRHSGFSNQAYVAALLEENKTKKGYREPKKDDSPESLVESRVKRAPKFVEHVVTGWQGIYGEDGQEAAFSQEDCLAFMLALPVWIWVDICNVAASTANFICDNSDAIAEK